MATTKIVAQPRGGGEAVAELQADIVSYGRRRNRPGATSLTLALDAPGATRSVLDPGASELAVIRDDSTVWVGPLLTVSEDDQTKQLALGGEGLMAYARKWFETTTVVHTATDQATIVKQFIDRHQAKGGGDFGIGTSDVDLTGITRDRTYWSWERKNVFDAIVQLAELENGFDITFDPADREMRIHYPGLGTRKPDAVLDERNIKNFRRDLDATTQASQSLGIGAGEGDEMLLASAQSSVAVARYGLTQHAFANKDVSVAATLAAQAAYRLDSAAAVPNIIAVTCSTEDPNPFTINPGDEIKVVWDSSYEPIDEFQRVVGIDIKFEKGSEERAVYYLEAI